MVYTVEQRHHDATAQFLLGDGVKCRLERRRLDGDPNDVERLVKPLGHPYGNLERPERFALNVQHLRIVPSAARPHE
jgi:hypothetical protein